MVDLKVLKTNKEGVKIVYNDFQYRKKKENMNGMITWKCCECPARLQTRLAPDYLNPRVLGVHNHLGQGCPNPGPQGHFEWPTRD